MSWAVNLQTVSRTWAIGVDQSDAGKFKVSLSSTLGYVDRLTGDNTGVKVTSGYSGGVSRTKFGGD